MKVFLIALLKLGLKIIYAPLKLLKTKNQVVYLSRQRNEKDIDFSLLEQALKDEDPSINQVFRLKMIDDGIVAKIKYCFYVIGDMYYLATSKVAVVDTYSITVSCLNHKKDLKVIQMWHALGATKRFGLQAVGTKEGRDEKISNAMCMHKNYDYVLAPSEATAEFYKQAFGVGDDKIKILPMPRVDFLTDGNAKTTEFYSQNPGMGDKKIVLYLPTFRDREAVCAQMLKVEFEDKNNLQLIISAHPLSKVKKDERYTANGDFSSFELMKIADVIITDYSACAYEASLLMKPLYFFTPDYDEYMKDRGINVDIKAEIPSAVFDDAEALVNAIENEIYDMGALFSFREKFINRSNNNSKELATFIKYLIEDN